MATKKDISHLSKKMQEFYNSIISDFALESHHEALLIRACESLDLSDQCREQVATDGLTTKDRYGSIKPHPLIKIGLDAKSNARLLLRELGLDLEPPKEPGRAPRQY